MRLGAFISVRGVRKSETDRRKAGVQLQPAVLSKTPRNRKEGELQSGHWSLKERVRETGTFKMFASAKVQN